jgi:hypothetical protein
MTDETVTIGQIAQAISRFSPDPSGLLERLRHWSRLGVIAIADQLHAGTGKHVLYPRSAILDAAFVCVLAQFGLPIASQRWMAQAQSKVRIAFAKWQQETGRQRAKPLFLEVRFDPPSAMIEEMHARRPKGMVSVQIDLQRLFTAVADPSSIPTAAEQAAAADAERRAEAAKAGKRRAKRIR